MLPVLLAYPTPYPKLLQPRGWTALPSAALPYVIQTSCSPFVYPPSPGSLPIPLFLILTRPRVMFTVDSPRCPGLWLCAPFYLTINPLLHHTFLFFSFHSLSTWPLLFWHLTAIHDKHQGTGTELSDTKPALHVQRPGLQTYPCKKNKTST